MATAFVLLVPLLAMRITREVNWSPLDFTVAGALLFGAGFAYELMARKAGDVAWRAAAGIAIAATLFLTWANLAVGMLGSENNPANLLYLLVPLIGLAGSVITRLRSRGMVLTTLAMALTMALIAVIALVGGLAGPRTGLLEILLLHGFFVALYLASAGLFRCATPR